MVFASLTVRVEICRVVAVIDEQGERELLVGRYPEKTGEGEGKDDFEVALAPGKLNGVCKNS